MTGLEGKDDGNQKYTNDARDDHQRKAHLNKVYKRIVARTDDEGNNG